MPRPRKPARLYQRRDGSWSILDGGRERRTGARDRAVAEKALALYLAERGRPGGPAAPHRLTVAAALAIYAHEHAPNVALPDKLLRTAETLIGWWGDTLVSEVTAGACRRYARERPVATGTARYELSILNAALRHCAREGHLTAAPIVTLPPPSPPRERWMTRSEAARLLWACRRTSPHLARFILVGLYTGTRHEAILGLRFGPHVAGGWIDVAGGILHRQAPGARRTQKRQPPARLPRKLRAHARRWEARSRHGWVVEWQGGRVGEIRRAWTGAVRRAGLGGKVTPHTLRHTAITWAMHAGVPLADAAGFFGVSVSVLERTYLHHHPRFQAATAAALDRGSRG